MPGGVVQTSVINAVGTGMLLSGRLSMIVAEPLSQQSRWPLEVANLFL